VSLVGQVWELHVSPGSTVILLVLSEPTTYTFDGTGQSFTSVQAFTLFTDDDVIAEDEIGTWNVRWFTDESEDSTRLS
jgi:hypothetical protein